MEDATSLRVSVAETDQPISSDPDYRRFERPKGILRWDIPVPPGSGENATALRYSYSLEFDKNQTLQDITTEKKTRLKTEFREKTRKTFSK